MVGGKTFQQCFVGSLPDISAPIHVSIFGAGASTDGTGKQGSARRGKAFMIVVVADGNSLR